MSLCTRAQESFDAFCEVPVVPTGQLYGGKFCAALDRQHPRDLFDVKYMLESEGFPPEVKAGLLLAVVSSDRPIHEVLDPTMLDQRSTFDNHFVGMTVDKFTYEDFERTRTQMLDTIHANLTADDREFLLSVKRLAPRWDLYQFEQFPSVRWKLQNLQTLQETNSRKYKQQLELLEKILS